MASEQQKKSRVYIHLEKEDMKFSAGHFTIFSAHERESLHGHNYRIAVTMGIPQSSEPVPKFDYRYYKKKLRSLCKELNETLLLPGQSPHLKIKKDGLRYLCEFSDEYFSFLERDVKILSVSNITVEQLCTWFIEQILLNRADMEKHEVEYLKVQVYSGPGQGAYQIWEAQ